MKFYNIKDIFPHRKYAHKTCYGSRLSDTWASDLMTSDIGKFSTDELFTELRKRVK